jgi:hypothetical protein
MMPSNAFRTIFFAGLICGGYSKASPAACSGEARSKEAQARRF